MGDTYDQMYDWGSENQQSVKKTQKTAASRLRNQTTPSWPGDDGIQLANKEQKMSKINFPGADKFMSRMFRKVDGVVWDMMTGKIGVATDEGIATLDVSDADSPRININLFDEFGMALPAFAQSTPVDAINVGDIIYRGKRDTISFVIEKKDGKFRVMNVDGTSATWTPPKTSMLGLESGVMVLRSLVNMLPTGQAGVNSMQNMLMPLMLMGGLEGDGVEKLMPFMLMSQMNGGGTGDMNGMMMAMMMSGMMKGNTFGDIAPRPTIKGPFSQS